MHVRIKSSLKSVSEKCKHEKRFQLKPLTAGGMSGDSHCVKVFALLPLRQIALLTIYGEQSLGRKKY